MKTFGCLFTVLFISLTLSPSINQPNARLIDILTNELNYDLQVKELEALQREAQYDYSDEYANYKLDMIELQKRRDNLLGSLRSEETRREIEEKGLGIQFQLAFYSNLTASLINIERRIHHLLALKDLRLDVLERLPLLTKKRNDKCTKIIEEDTARLKEIESEIATLNKEVKVITGDKKTIAPEGMKKLKFLYEKYKDLASDRKQKQVSLARLRWDVISSEKSIENIKRIKPLIEEAFAKLEHQRERLFKQVTTLKRDIKAFNVNDSTVELARKVTAVWGEVTVISNDLGQFMADYAELQNFQKEIYVTRMNREDITLEHILSESKAGMKDISTDEEILEWIRSLQ